MDDRGTRNDLGRRFAEPLFELYSENLWRSAGVRQEAPQRDSGAGDDKNGELNRKIGRDHLFAFLRLARPLRKFRRRAFFWALVPRAMKLKYLCS